MDSAATANVCKERKYKIALIGVSISAGALLVAFIVFCILFFYIRTTANKAVRYTTGMVDQSQVALNATSCLRTFYKTFDYFDKAMGDPDTGYPKGYVDVSIGGYIGGTYIGTDGSWSESSTSTNQFVKGLTVSELLNALKISSYFTYIGGTSNSSSNNYITFSYNYPENKVTKTIKYDLSDYKLNSSDIDSIVERIKSNWVNAVTTSDDVSDCVNGSN